MLWPLDLPLKIIPQNAKMNLAEIQEVIQFWFVSLQLKIDLKFCI